MKFIIYPAVILIEFISINILSKVLSISTENTWLGAIGVDLIFVTIIIILIDIAKKFRNKNTFVFYLISILIILLILVTVLVNIIYFINSSN